MRLVLLAVLLASLIGCRRYEVSTCAAECTPSKFNGFVSGGDIVHVYVLDTWTGKVKRQN